MKTEEIMDKWTLDKINQTIKELRQNGLIQFNFGRNSLDELKLLDEYAFKKRQDFILRISTVTDDNIIKNNELLFLSELKNIKKIAFSYINNDTLEELREMTQLEYFENMSSKRLDINFLNGLNELKVLRMYGKIKNLKTIEKCINLEDLFLSTTIENYNFIKPLTKLSRIGIDSCISINDFTLLNKPMLKEIHIGSIKNMENIDSIKELKYVEKLRLEASRIKLLPEMSKLVNLKELDLRILKIWENPYIIKTMPKLEKLVLREINTKLQAEEFYFLTEIETLNEIDFRFIDFNKNRIEKLNKWFKENGKENILKK